MTKIERESLKRKIKKDEDHEKFITLIYEVADAVAKKYADSLLASGLPKEWMDRFSSELPVGVALEEILSRFPPSQEEE